MIIVEGPDGSGKTTLANALAERLELEYRKSPASATEGGNRGTYEWWADQIKFPCPLGSIDAVYDRCHFISEPIYQLVMPRRELCTTSGEMTAGIFGLSALYPIVVFCLPDWNTALDNVEREGRDKLDISNNQLMKVHWVYHTYYALWSLTSPGRVFQYTYTNDREHHAIVRDLRMVLNADRVKP